MSTVPALLPVVPIGDVIGAQVRATPEMQRWMNALATITRDYEKRIADLEARVTALEGP